VNERGHRCPGLAPQVGAAWLRDLTPYHCYLDQPSINGPNVCDVAALGGCAVVGVVVGGWRLNRRDLRR
jgi:hypothetical protein